MSSKDQSIKLNDGRSMPLLGLGTWKSAPGVVGAVVKHALSVGYRHIDCAFVYGNEKEIGEALEEAFRDGIVKREDVFITSKCWLTYLTKSRARECLNTTLKDLRLDYLDLYLVHWPMALKQGVEVFPKDADGKVESSDVSFLETWEAFEEFQQEGLVKSIGISNFNSLQIKELLEKCRVQPSVNQCEIHPFLNNEKLVKFCQSKGIAMTAYSPFASPDRPEAKADDVVLWDDPKIKSIAEKHGRSVAQILIRFSIERNISVIPKSADPGRVKENSNVFDFSLDADDMTALMDMNRDDGRRINADFCSHLFNYPFVVEF